MGDLIYRELINDMTWSYSRVKTFHDCPYRWFLKYIHDCKEVPMFYSSYGSFMHKLLEQYYKGMLSKEEIRNNTSYVLTNDTYCTIVCLQRNLFE